MGRAAGRREVKTASLILASWLAFQVLAACRRAQFGKRLLQKALQNACHGRLARAASFLSLDGCLRGALLLHASTVCDTVWP